jgi:hypothetical protein
VSTYDFVNTFVERLHANILCSRVFIFYPVSALMSIFFNILRNPRHEYATHDTELLTLATKVIRSMPILKVTTHEVEYLRKMDAFVEELGRLSQAAIAKAQNENS